MENYLDFLTARRELLAQAANTFLAKLLSGSVPESDIASVLDRQVEHIPGSIDSHDEERLLQECNGWVIDQSLLPGEPQYELVDEETRDILAYFDLAWPDGLQQGYSQPVALLLNESDETYTVAQKAG